MDELDEMARAYLECAAWAGWEASESDIFPDWEWAQSARDQAQTDCAHFENECQKEGIDLFSIMTPDQAGHDLWLTRNGHGSGFWDRELGDIGQRLTKLCQYQPRYIALGDDGLLHIEGA